MVDRETTGDPCEEATPQVAATSHLLDKYLPVVSAAGVDELRALARPLEGAPVEMVNSTAVGGVSRKSYRVSFRCCASSVWRRVGT